MDIGALYKERIECDPAEREEIVKKAQRAFEGLTLTTAWHCPRCGGRRPALCVACPCGGLAPHPSGAVEVLPGLSPGDLPGLPVFGAVVFAQPAFVEARLGDRWIRVTLDDVGEGWPASPDTRALLTLLLRALALAALAPPSDRTAALLERARSLIAAPRARRPAPDPLASIAIGRGQRL